MVTGILAHVDAGKTTLSENILFKQGAIRKVGRVDNGDTFLDTDELEKKRGITIYSKEAVFQLGEKTVYLIDTPGHVDFSAEMERSLSVLDMAILVINGADGVQAHTTTLWKLLMIYNIPVFIFVNKMDQEIASREKLIKDIEKLTEGKSVVMENIEEDEVLERIAMSNEEVLDYYMENGRVLTEHIINAISERNVYPVYFGSALKDEGVGDLLFGIEKYTKEKKYGKDFLARVFKITRDEKGNRLTYMKILGGKLATKEVLTGGREEKWEEKAEQIRIYSGDKYEAVNEVEAGCICAVTGLNETYAGELLGGNDDSDIAPILEPVLMYRVIFRDGINMLEMVRNLKELEEENPQLRLMWNEETKELCVKVMGKVQLEVLKSVIRERFREDVEFDTGSIVYKETIEELSYGVGHFEPLRHYAEVHLTLEPLPANSGLIFETKCSEDELDKNWQKLILTHLHEKEHRGVLTGSVITDMKITLVAGRAHKKHTEGGDFRQATYRAVRHGLKCAKSKLLEPYYRFRLEVPAEVVGRAMTDIGKMSGDFESPENDGEIAIITGRCPVLTMAEYSAEVAAYTKGKGSLTCIFDGYDKCHNEEEVIEKIAYDSESDVNNPTGSMFCAHGAGFYVPWEEVRNYMHLECALDKKKNDFENVAVRTQTKKENLDYYAGEKELEEIFARTYGAPKEKPKNTYKKTVVYKGADNTNKEYVYKPVATGEEYLLVDGYNIIFAWEELNELSKVNLDGARMRLMEILCNYQGYKKCKLIVVFDAYKVKGNKGSVEKYKNIHVVYTREAETADQYIEKTVHEIGKKYHVTVATSDRLEQMIIMGEGASRLSAKAFYEEVVKTEGDIRNYLT